MATKAGVGFSGNPKAADAGKEATIEAIKALGNPGLLIVFGSINYDQKELLDGIRQVNNNAPLIGCSDAGEISNGGSREKGVVVMAIESDSINFTIGTGGKVSDGTREAGVKLAKDIVGKTDGKMNCLIMLTDVLSGNGADIVRGIQDELGKDFLIVGGAAGDDFLFKETFVYYNDSILPSSIVGAGLSGNFAIGVGVRHGWVPIGLPKKVTKSQGAVLEELDGKPAVSIYEEHFGRKAEDLRKEPLAIMAITYPLGMSVEGSDELLIRDPITVDDKGAITCAAEIPVGSDIRLMIGSREEAVMAAKEAATHALEGLNGSKPRAAIIFNCIARYKLLGRAANEEIEAIQSILGPEVPLIGFYTYGEQAPLGGDMQKKFSCFHNETAVILVLGD